MSALSPGISLHVPDPAFVLSEDGVYLAAMNGPPGLCYHLHEQLTGMTLHEALPAGLANWVLEEVRAAIGTGMPRVVEYQLDSIDVVGLDHDKGPRGSQWFEGRITPLPSTPGKPRAALWVARNIQLQKDMQARLGMSVPLDPLTGVLDRTGIAAPEVARDLGWSEDRNAIMMIVMRLTNAAQVRRTHGDQMHELLLRQMCYAMVVSLPQDALPVRLGDSSFGAMLAGDESRVQQLAETLDSAFRSLVVQDSDDNVLRPIVGLSRARMSMPAALADALAHAVPLLVTGTNLTDGGAAYGVTAN